MTTLEQAVGDRLAAAVEQADQRQADARTAWGTADPTWRLSFGLGRRTTTSEQEENQP